MTRPAQNFDELVYLARVRVEAHTRVTKHGVSKVKAHWRGRGDGSPLTKPVYPTKRPKGKGIAHYGKWPQKVSDYITEHEPDAPGYERRSGLAIAAGNHAAWTDPKKNLQARLPADLVAEGNALIEADPQHVETEQERLDYEAAERDYFKRLAEYESEMFADRQRRFGSGLHFEPSKDAKRSVVENAYGYPMLSGEEHSAAVFYTHDSGIYNEPLRDEYLNGKTIPPDQQKRIDALDSAIAKSSLDKAFVVSRYTTLSEFGAETRVELLEMVGSIYKQPAYLSTTTKESDSHSVVMDILVPPNTNGIYMEEEFTEYQGEYELLLGRGLNLFIHEVVIDDDGNARVKAEIIPAAVEMSALIEEVRHGVEEAA